MIPRVAVAARESLRRHRAFVAAALVAWTLGAALGLPPRDASAARPLFQIGKAHAEFTPAMDGSEPIFILFIGSDARPGQAVDRQRADSIHLVGINLEQHRAAILGFPRDSWVPIPGYGTQKINASMVYGGPPLVVETVESLTGITIDYYVLTSFEGFKAMVDSIGGMVVEVQVPMFDRYAKTHFDPGRYRLNGHDTLGFARDRHSLSSGDFGRSENQGRVFLFALRQFQKEYAKDPSRLLTWIGAGLRNTESTLSIRETLELAFTAASISPKDIENMVTPGSTGSQGGASVVYISSSAQAIYRDMADDGLVENKNLPPVQVP
ncbi:MAG TPA: LCP family protein [Actinomycetota bacterium]|nr:LCP family protein [Actinomycetota bacterium]